MNVFHWHITDTQSFPLHLSSLPEFSRYGAYSPDKVYTPQQVRDLVTYARERGVRVIPELDAPAHVGKIYLSSRIDIFSPVTEVPVLVNWKKKILTRPGVQQSQAQGLVLD